MIRILAPVTGETLLDLGGNPGCLQREIELYPKDRTPPACSMTVNCACFDRIALVILSFRSRVTGRIILQPAEPAWAMNFSLSGHIRIGSGRSSKQACVCAKTYQYADCAGNEQLVFCIDGTASILSIFVAEKARDHLLTEPEQELLKHRFVKLRQGAECRPVISTMSGILGNLFSYTGQHTLSRMLLISKILELLAIDLENTRPAAAAALCCDQDKLEKAKQLIGENLRSPCTLVELAHKVGINDFKLKKNFKAAFGNTVFGYLFDLRMEKARQMLSSSTHSISEIAAEVGYKNGHHFTAAFKKKYGCVPSRMKNSD